MFNYFKKKTTIITLFLLAFGGFNEAKSICNYPAEFQCCVKDDRKKINDHVKISHRRPGCGRANEVTNGNITNGKFVSSLLHTTFGKLCLKRLTKGKHARHSIINYPKTKRWCKNLGGKIAPNHKCGYYTPGITLTADNRAVCDFWNEGGKRK